MNISLVIPPSPFLIDDRVFPFLGPLSIAAIAREKGHDVRVHDLTGYKRRHPEVKHADSDTVLAEAQAELVRQLPQDVDMVGFYSLAAQHPHVVSFLRAVKEHRPDALTVLGGPHANTDPQSCVEDGFDQVVVSDQGGGGGEPGFLEVLKRRREFRARSHEWFTKNRVVKVPSRDGAEWENDKWPLPARDLIDLPSYRYTLKGERCTSTVSTTGCPYACIYCSHWESYRKLEAKSSQRVAEELEYIKSTYDIRAVMDYSDEINLRPDFRSEFLPMMKKSGFIWRAFFKNGKNLTEPDVFREMAESGCVQLCTGAESANPQILKAIKKGATLQHNTDFVRYCVASGIEPKVFTQVGLAGETPDTIKELRNWIVEVLVPLGLRDFDCTITIPYEGTPMHDEPEKFGVIFDREELRAATNGTIKKLPLYKGTPGEYQSFVSYASLTREDLVAGRQWIEDEGRKAIGLPPLLAKDDG